MYPSLPFLPTQDGFPCFRGFSVGVRLAALIVTAFFRLASPGMQLATNALLPLDMVFVVVEALVLAGFLASCFASDGPAGTSAQSLMSGNIAPLFLGWGSDDGACYLRLSPLMLSVAVCPRRWLWC